jgi:hypothetical protein
MSVTIANLVTSGMFSLDGGTWDVDNNVWIVGNDEECANGSSPFRRKQWCAPATVAAPRLGRSGRRWPVSAKEGHSQERPPAGSLPDARKPASGPPGLASAERRPCGGWAISVTRSTAMRSHAKDRGPARGPTNAGCSPYSR